MSKQRVEIEVPEGYEVSGQAFTDYTHQKTLVVVVPLRRKKRKEIVFVSVDNFDAATKDEHGYAFGTWRKHPTEINCWSRSAENIQWYRREEREVDA